MELKVRLPGFRRCVARPHDHILAAVRPPWYDFAGVATVAHYEIEEELGRGGMGVVYRAKDTIIGRQVAIKALSVGLTSKSSEAPEFREALLKEARAAGQLTHPNIVTIHHALLEGGCLYVVMELVEGHTLEAELPSSALEALERRLALLSQAAQALDYAHSRGVVHRDVKPSNFLVNSDGILKLTDFGIAKLSGATGGSSTQLVGTPHYMSPEQVEGRRVNGRSDQFSLAVVAWTLLTGERPFRGDSAVAVLYNIVHSAPLRQESSSTPRAAIETLERALSKDPERRFSTCQDFVAALSQSMRPNDEAIGVSTTRPVVPAKWWVTLLIAVSVAAAAWYRSARSPAAAVRQSEIREPKTAQNRVETSAKQQAAQASTQRESLAERASPAKTPGSQKAATRPFTAPKTSAQLGQPVLGEAPPVSGPPAHESNPMLPFPTQEAPKFGIATGAAPAARMGPMTWDGELKPGEQVTIDGESSSPGNLSGKFLPGLPVGFQINPDRLTIVERPGPGNAWRRIILRNKMNFPITHFTIQWHVIQ